MGNDIPTVQGKGMQYDTPSYDYDCELGVTDSGDYITTHRWNNELFRLLLIDEYGTAKSEDLLNHPSHLGYDKLEYGLIWITTGVADQNFNNWMITLERKGLIHRTQGEEWALTDKGIKILSHVRGGEHTFRTGFCTMCLMPKTWDDPEGNLSRLEKLVHNPDDNPAKDARKRAYEEQIDVESVAELLHPDRGEYIAAGSSTIADDLLDEDNDIPRFEWHESVRNRLDKLKQEGVIAKSPFHDNAYIWSNGKITIKNGEVKYESLNESKSILSILTR